MPSFASTLRNGRSPDWRLRVKVITAPDEFPITVEEVKQHLRITNNAEDSYLQGLIATATELAQEVLGRYFLNHGLEGFFDARYGMQTLTWDRCWRLWADNPIELLGLPLASVEEMAVYDDSNTKTVVDPTTYFVDTSDLDMPGRIALRGNAYWPTLNDRLVNSVGFQYTCGYGTTSADVPATIRHGLKTLVSFLYANRGDCTCGSGDVTACVTACGGFSTLLSKKAVRF